MVMQSQDQIQQNSMGAASDYMSPLDPKQQ